jgi:hypothetical protein
MLIEIFGQVHKGSGSAAEILLMRNLDAAVNAASKNDFGSAP